MINSQSFFEEVKTYIALICPDDQDGTDLAHFAQTAVQQNIPILSVPVSSVAPLWTWVEKEPIKILARFFLDAPINNDIAISDLSKQVNAVFKSGAVGAQIFIDYQYLNSFGDDILAIRDDLFFNKKLIIGLDISSIGPFDWPDVFKVLNKIRADGLMLVMDIENDDADFVGSIYSLMEYWDLKFKGELHLAFGNDHIKLEQVWRLAKKMRPEITERIMFFINK